MTGTGILGQGRLAVARVVTADGPMHGMIQGVAIHALTQGVNLLTGIITARFLGPDGRGFFAVITLWPQFLAMLLVAGTPIAITVQLRGRGRELRHANGAIVTLGLAMTLLGGLLAQIVIPLALHAWPAEIVDLSRAMAWFLLINVFSTLLRPVFLVTKDYRVFNFFQIASPLVYLLSLGLVISFDRLTAASASLCLLISGLPMLVWACVRLWRATGIALDRVGRWLGRLLSYSWRAYFAEAFGVVSTYADRLVLAALVTPAQLGLYVVALSAARLIGLLPYAIGPILLRAMSDASPAYLAELHYRGVRLVFVAMVAAALPLALAGGTAIAFVFGDAFAGAVTVFRLLLVDVVLTGTIYIAAQTLFAAGHPGAVSTAQGLGVATSFAGMIALTPIFGLNGAAGAMIVGSTVRGVVVFWRLGGAVGLGVPQPFVTPADIAFIVDRLRSRPS